MSTLKTDYITDAAGTGAPDFTNGLVVSAGNVGIGTDAPSYDLDISKSGTAEVAVRIKNTNTGGADPDAMLYLDSGNVDGEAVVEFMKGGTSYGRLSALDSDMRLASDTGDIKFTTGGSVSAIINSSGNVGIGTASPGRTLDVSGIIRSDGTSGAFALGGNSSTPAEGAAIHRPAADTLAFVTASTEAARITSDGDFIVGKTAIGDAPVGVEARSIGFLSATRDANVCLQVNRLTNDGTLVIFKQATTTEGTISVSGTTVSYNGGHLSRWAQFPDNSRPELLKGTIMSNLDQMANWDQEDNEQLNCVEVSAVEGDANVAGVFVAWDSTDDGYNDILLAMTGDMVIRIAGGTTVQRGDLLMSAGDGTAKPQGDDIVRSKTIAKVTSTHVSHTYADGSYAVPCVLMAC